MYFHTFFSLGKLLVILNFTFKLKCKIQVNPQMLIEREFIFMGYHLLNFSSNLR